MAKDKFHGIFREALEKDGWTITHDPFRLKFGTRKIEIDIGAEKLIAAERGTEKIVAEVKSFLEQSVFYEFHEALGQFINYRRMMKIKGIQRQLFLAIPTDAYEVLFEDEFGRLTIQEEELSLVVFSPDKRTIVKWIK